MHRLPDPSAVESFVLPAALRSKARPSQASPRALAAKAQSGVKSEHWLQLLGGQALAEAEMRALTELVQLRPVLAAESVFRSQTRADHVIAVLEGVVGLGSIGPQGQFHLERSAHGPAWLDISSAWVGQGHTQDAQAMGPALLLELPVKSLRPLLHRYPDLQDRFMLALAQTVQSLTGVTHDLMAKDAQKRLISWLLQRMAAPAGEVALRERKRELAAQLAITPETLSRLLRQLMAAGLIEVKGYSIKLLKLADLRALAQA
nr:Crp/Fnr family transcriptional regulator [uncultured Roseateles sp.]